MIYQFDTDDQDAATAALLVYAVYRSRDKARYKIKPDMWSQIERFVKASAKRARSVGEFIESFKPKLLCGSILPKALTVGTMPVGGGAEVQLVPREFGLDVLAVANHGRVLSLLYRETTMIILLVRGRLENERPMEKRLEAALEAASEPVQLDAPASEPAPELVKEPLFS